jgi:lipopolysaccharide export system protein LptC
MELSPALARIAERASAWFPVLLLLILAGLTYWLDQSVRPVAAPQTRPASADPDFIAEGFSAVQLGPDGTSRYLVSGDRMVHYANDDTAVVDEPRLVQTEPGKPPINISARRGKVTANGDNVYLMDDVRIVREQPEPRGPVVMTTSYLHVMPREDLAQTDKAVTIRDGSTEIHAQGLEFNNKTRVATLFQVKGRYDPPPKK